MQGRTTRPAALSLAAMLGLSALLPTTSAPAATADEKPIVVLETSLGPITVELESQKAPITVENFLKYVDKGFFDGVVFHRVIPGFMVQTGGFSEDGGVLQEKRKDAFPSIKNESGKGLSNARGTLAMARTNDPNSATSQFFINLVDNNRLDSYGGGYAVFGKVTEGMDVVDKIAQVQTTAKRNSDGDSNPNVPITPIVLRSAKRKPKS